MISLVRQRQVIERERIIGTLLAGVAGANVLFNVAVLVDGGPQPTYGFSVLAFGVVAVIGFRQVHKARRDLAAFEAEHGVGAGVQQPIR